MRELTKHEVGDFISLLLTIEDDFTLLKEIPVLSMVAKDYGISQGIEFLSVRLPKISMDELESSYMEQLDISGSESVIYLKPNDNKYVYKLNDPLMKVDSGEFNDYLLSLLLQEFLFPEFRYKKFTICDDKLFMQQLISKGRITTPDEIRTYLEAAGWTFSYGSYLTQIQDFIVIMEDVNPGNALMSNVGLECFDAKFKVMKL